MSEQHTPGPWAAKDGRICYHVVSENGLFSTGCISFDGNGLANARLIAAAPDLLASLKTMVANCTNGEGAISPEPQDRGQWLDGMVSAREAITKAEGR